MSNRTITIPAGMKVPRLRRNDFGSIYLDGFTTYGGPEPTNEATVHQAIALVIEDMARHEQALANLRELLATLEAP